ncbi:MAG: glycosyltransferase family 2 protein [Limisphaerales bacterium]
MPIPSTPKISVIIPVYGNLGDLDRLLAGLRKQTIQPHEIILVDSSPKSSLTPPPGVKYVRNPKGDALSWDYNFGAQQATGDFLLNMQQDCVPEDPRALEMLYNSLSDKRVAAVPLVTLPRENWEQYNFWGKVMMARWVGRVHQGISGKLDLIRRDVFLKIGGYDTERFSFAGEDMDLFLRLSEQGEVFISNAEIIHYHSQKKPLRFRDMLTKHYQLAESFGALFRRWGVKLKQIPYSGHWTHHLAKYLYPLVPLSFVLAFVSPSAAWTTLGLLLVLTQFTNMEGWRVKEAKTPVLLFANPVLFVAGFWGTLVGFVTGKQRYSQNK